MNPTPSRLRTLRPAAHTLLALAAATLLGRPALAADGGEVARFLAVGGSVSSWALALWNGAPLTDCGQAKWQFRSQIGRDKELEVASVGAAYGECRLLERGGWQLSHQPSLMASQWRAKGVVTGASRATDLAFVPLLHWQRPMGGLKFELELGVGPTWLSEPDIGARIKSTHFQFSDSVGLGVSDPTGAWRLGLTWRHISNSDIKTPNQAVDFKALTLAFAL